MNDLERYLSKCDPPNEQGCRLWNGGTDDDGYGFFVIADRPNGTKWRAHRWGYLHLVGPIGPGLVVCHRCDVPACQTPEHWWLGTNADNTADRVAKGRSAGGRPTVLTPERVDVIRELRKAGLSGRAIGRQIGISRSSVERIT